MDFFLVIKINYYTYIVRSNLNNQVNILVVKDSDKESKRISVINLTKKINIFLIFCLNCDEKKMKKEIK